MGDTTKLEDSRDAMRDLALPPGYHIGTDPDGALLVVNDSTAEIFALDAPEEDLPMVVVDLWREYLNEAPAVIIARLIHIITAVDALLNWEGEIRGGPRQPPVLDGEEECSYACILYGAHGAPEGEAQGLDNDPINAVLIARRNLFESLQPSQPSPPEPKAKVKGTTPC